jgi:hypothetical protein
MTTMTTMRLLSDPLPLRPAVALPAYRADASDRTLPWVYGRATVSPVPLSADGLEWLVADHPVVAVERVTVGESVTDGWQLAQRLDDTGHAIAVLRLTQPPQSGQSVSVTVAGRRHPASGALIEHPADVAQDLLRHAGWAVTPDMFQGLRDAFPGLALGLVLDAPQRLRDALSAVVEPLGAVWRTAPAAAMPMHTGTPVAVLDARTADSIRASCDSSTLATVAHVRYAHDWASGAARGSLTVAAPESVAQFGTLETTLDLPAVRTARDALAIATARLRHLARPVWTVEATLPGSTQIAVGDTVSLAHPRVPAGDALVLTTAHDRARDTLQITAWMPAGAAPRIELLTRGSAVDPSSKQDAVVFRDGLATFTITDDTGAPLAGAAVTLDGQDMRNTDRQGQVQFRTTRGPHTLDVYAAGFAPFRMEVVV